ncbi:MAG TPA: CHAP domain-containing protein [Solirubrobacterales bacterium]|nr:CHAP domain-containing protein [Solirubrobacterales bacterium]
MSRRRSRTSLLALFAAGAAAIVIATLAGTVMAILGGELACLGGGGGTATATPATRAAVEEIPPGRLRIFQAAGRRIDIDWTFLASIGEQECGSGNCSGVNSSGCAGPMQIAYVRGSACSPGSGPTIWETYKVDGDGDGVTDINDPADAIFTAARILRKVLGGPPAGGSYAAYRQAACGYYGACADSSANYADEVMARAVSYGFRGMGAPSPIDAKAAEPATIGGGSSCGATFSGSASGSEIVRIAESQLGRTESPLGSNCNPYGPCVEWCSLFVAWVWEKAGVPLRGGTAPYAYSGSVYEWAKAHEAGPSLPGAAAPGESPFSTAAPHGARVLSRTATPAPGDAVLFGTGPANSDHIGIVERVFPGGQITTIDGNYSDRVARVGPFLPSRAVYSGEPAPIFGYAQPPGVGGSAEGAVR